jgi:uncharacterized membrane protein HdeD (DUF308 family)
VRLLPSPLPSAATWVIGLLHGIELIAGGWTIVVSALTIREADKTQAHRKESIV